MRIKPAGHRVLVELDKIEEVTSGGIVLARENGGSRDKYAVEEASVIEIGPQAFKAFDDGQPWCKVGDKVKIVKYSGLRYEDNGIVFSIINDDDIFGVIEE